jgi:2-iminobutanoate/2-iminopropanoate deaminase
MQVMKNLEAILKDAGGGFDNVVKTTVLLADMGDFAAVNEIYGVVLTHHRSSCCVNGAAASFHGSTAAANASTLR